MIIRNIVYALAFIFFLAVYYFIPRNPELAKDFILFWKYALAGIALEAAIRMGKGKYLFFPIGYGLMFLYGIYNLPYYEYSKILGGLLHLGLAVLFFLEYRKTPKEDREFRMFFLGIGVFALLFTSKMILMVPGGEILAPFFNINLSSIGIVAIAGRFLLLNRIRPNYPQLDPLTGFLLVIHGFLILESVFDRLFLS